MWRSADVTSGLGIELRLGPGLELVIWLTFGIGLGKG